MDGGWEDPPAHQRVSPLNLTPQATFNTTNIYNVNSVSIATADRKGTKSTSDLLFFVWNVTAESFLFRFVWNMKAELVLFEIWQQKVCCSNLFETLNSELFFYLKYVSRKFALFKYVWNMKAELFLFEIWQQKVCKRQEVCYLWFVFNIQYNASRLCLLHWDLFCTKSLFFRGLVNISSTGTEMCISQTGQIKADVGKPNNYFPQIWNRFNNVAHLGCWYKTNIVLTCH